MAVEGTTNSHVVQLVDQPSVILDLYVKMEMVFVFQEPLVPRGLVPFLEVPRFVAVRPPAELLLRSELVVLCQLNVVVHLFLNVQLDLPLFQVVLRCVHVT
jgi:hypothetical protein